MKKLFVVLFLSAFILVFGLITSKSFLSSGNEGEKRDTALEKQIYETYERLDKEYVERVYALSDSPSDDALNSAEEKALTETAAQYNVSESEAKGIIVRLTTEKYK